MLKKVQKMTESGGKTSIFGQNFGRSDRVRTCGIDIPNVARYQLRHTPIYLVYARILTEIPQLWDTMWS